MKPFKETKLGGWLKEHAPEILDTVGDVIPDRGLLGVVKRMVTKAAGLSPEQKQEFDSLAAAHELEYFKEENRTREAEQHELTERHKTDMSSDSWLSKNVRPMTLCYMLLLYTVLVILDSSLDCFKVPDAYITMLSSLLMMVFAFYFGSRMLEKFQQMQVQKTRVIHLGKQMKEAA